MRWGRSVKCSLMTRPSTHLILHEKFFRLDSSIYHVWPPSRRQQGGILVALELSIRVILSVAGHVWGREISAQTPPGADVDLFSADAVEHLTSTPTYLPEFLSLLLMMGLTLSKTNSRSKLKLVKVQIESREYVSRRGLGVVANEYVVREATTAFRVTSRSLPPLTSPSFLCLLHLFLFAWLRVVTSSGAKREREHYVDAMGLSGQVTTRSG